MYVLYVCLYIYIWEYMCYMSKSCNCWTPKKRYDHVCSPKLPPFEPSKPRQRFGCRTYGRITGATMVTCREQWSVLCSSCSCTCSCLGYLCIYLCVLHHHLLLYHPLLFYHPLLYHNHLLYHNFLLLLLLLYHHHHHHHHHHHRFILTFPLPLALEFSERYPCMAGHCAQRM